MAQTLKFPKGFFWGTGTSAYQVEGKSPETDWRKWEVSKKRLDALKKSKKNPNEYINWNACNHYSLYEKDFDLCKRMNNDAHRFSIEWARIMPAKGKIDEKEIRHYLDVIKALQKRKIEPFVTAYHFTLPQWIAEQGGWLSKDTITYFEDYISLLSERFKDVKFWFTMNEPIVIAYHSYKRAEWPPADKKKSSFFHWNTVFRNLVKAHKRAYAILKEKEGREVSLAINMLYFQDWQLFLDEYFYNWRFFRSVVKEQDFIGLNYYTRKTISPRDNVEKNELGWDIYPEGLYFLLKKLKKYNKPVYIAENGVAADDAKREDFIRNHLYYIHKAQQEGIDVRGYFYWSLLDNFEWTEGFTKRFGLVDVDFRTMERKPRKSAALYGEICRKNALEIK